MLADCCWWIFQLLFSQSIVDLFIIIDWTIDQHQCARCVFIDPEKIQFAIEMYLRSEVLLKLSNLLIVSYWYWLIAMKLNKNLLIWFNNFFCTKTKRQDLRLSIERARREMKINWKGISLTRLCVHSRNNIDDDMTCIGLIHTLDNHVSIKNYVIFQYHQFSTTTATWWFDNSKGCKFFLIKFFKFNF